MINFITTDWSSLSKDEAIRIAISERNKANECKDLLIRKALLEEIRKFESYFKIGVEHGTDKDITVGGEYKMHEMKAPSLRASIFDISNKKSNKK